MTRVWMVALCAYLASVPPVSAQYVEVTAGRAHVGASNDGSKEVSLVTGLKNSTDLPTPELIDARRALVAGSHVSPSKIRALADLQDGFAAYRFAQYLEAKSDPDLAADVAHYYGIAAATGRGGALRGMVQALQEIDPERTSEGRLQSLKAVFLAYLRAGNSHALKVVVGFHISEKPFGPLGDDIEKIVQLNGAPGAGPIALQLASVTLQTKDAELADLERARAYLEIARASPSLSVRATAVNLIPVAESALKKQHMDGLEQAGKEKSDG
ncbi:hypothetical protein [Shimia sp.]|uniref:hypothetical protein n=1 Tax=Shimia sp. TaxID=1954381 RepID=UPI003BA8D924